MLSGADIVAGRAAKYAFPPISTTSTTASGSPRT